MTDYVIRESETFAEGDIEIAARGYGETRGEAATEARERIAAVWAAYEGEADDGGEAE